MMLLAISTEPHAKKQTLHKKLQQERNRKIGYNDDKSEMQRLRQALSGSKRIKIK